jgi:hypothetical protein
MVDGMTIIGLLLGFAVESHDGLFDRLGVRFPVVTDVGRLLGTSLGPAVGV